MKRRNADGTKLRRNLKRNKLSEGFCGSALVYVRFFVVWLAIMLFDFVLDFRFEYLWPLWLFLRSAYESFRYQGWVFSVFFVCVAATSDVICLVFIPVTWLFFLASTYVWVQYVWHTERGICLPTVLLWIMIVYIEAKPTMRYMEELRDVYRPLAAHCIGYPVITFGFGVKSYFSFKMRLRKQREVAGANEFYTWLLNEALPAFDLLPMSLNVDGVKHSTDNRLQDSANSTLSNTPHATESKSLSWRLATTCSTGNNNHHESTSRYEEGISNSTDLLLHHTSSNGHVGGSGGQNQRKISSHQQQQQKQYNNNSTKLQNANHQANGNPASMVDLATSACHDSSYHHHNNSSSNDVLYCSTARSHQSNFNTTYDRINSSSTSGLDKSTKQRTVERESSSWLSWLCSPLWLLVGLTSSDANGPTASRHQRSVIKHSLLSSGHHRNHNKRSSTMDNLLPMVDDGSSSSTNERVSDWLKSQDDEHLLAEDGYPNGSSQHGWSSKRSNSNASQLHLQQQQSSYNSGNSSSTKQKHAQQRSQHLYTNNATQKGSTPLSNGDTPEYTKQQHRSHSSGGGRAPSAANLTCSPSASQIAVEELFDLGANHKLNSNSVNATSSLMHADREKVQNKDVTLSLESDIEKLREDLRSSRTSERELRHQVNQLAADEKGLKSENLLLKQNNDSLQTKLHNLVRKRQQESQEKASLEKKMNDVEKKLNDVESKLKDERKLKKVEEAAAARALALANSGRDCINDKCRSRLRDLDSDVKKMQREVRNRDDQLVSMEQELHDLRKFKDLQNENEVLMSALQAMQDKTKQLEITLSAETRIKLELFSALGEANRKLDETKHDLIRKQKECMQLGEQLFGNHPSMLRLQQQQQQHQQCDRMANNTPPMHFNEHNFNDHVNNGTVMNGALTPPPGDIGGGIGVALHHQTGAGGFMDYGSSAFSEANPSYMAGFAADIDPNNPTAYLPPGLITPVSVVGSAMFDVAANVRGSMGNTASQM